VIEKTAWKKVVCLFPARAQPKWFQRLSIQTFFRVVLFDVTASCGFHTSDATLLHLPLFRSPSTPGQDRPGVFWGQCKQRK
jgi:hypothetical protein